MIWIAVRSDIAETQILIRTAIFTNGKSLARRGRRIFIMAVIIKAILHEKR